LELYRNKECSINERKNESFFSSEGLEDVRSLFKKSIDDLRVVKVIEREEHSFLLFVVG
jgi:hypothetical protein